MASQVMEAVFFLQKCDGKTLKKQMILPDMIWV